MHQPKVPRVMWLLNHMTARKFEIKQLKRLGCPEIFLPKQVPDRPNFRSTSIDFSEDAHLTIPPEALEKLNATDWYGGTDLAAWEIANRYFDIVFTIFDAETIKSVAQHFQGAILLRVYGLAGSNSYGRILESLTQNQGKKIVESLGRRFWFAQAYPQLHELEPDYIARRSLYLPLGLADDQINDNWQGGDHRVFFICPDIGINPYYKALYNQFIQNFRGIPYVIGGGQPIPIADANVLGFVPRAVFDDYMRQLSVMFYHSTEPNHIHYHPFEAVRAGMPLVFMAGGMLDRFGGRSLPGRCRSIREARQKLQRILKGDTQLIQQIRQSQACLLEPMKFENSVQAWQEGFNRVRQELAQARSPRPALLKRRRRIAVILPVAYLGGSLRGTQLLAQAIALGSQQAGEDVEVVFAHLDQPDVYNQNSLEELDASVKRRPYQWRVLDPQQARRAMLYFGLEIPGVVQSYQVPEDGMQQLMDCDLWILVSDRLQFPLLPVRPYVVMLYDYLQRHDVQLAHFLNQQQCLDVAHAAQRVFVTTQFTFDQAIHYAGIPEQKLRRLPMLIPDFSAHGSRKISRSQHRYFLWSTNLAHHKNHKNALLALRHYYEELEGCLHCYVTGVNSQQLPNTSLPHLQPLIALWETSAALRSQVKFLGNLPEMSYQNTLAGSEFVWHPTRVDNGTFSVVEAAQYGIPALSSDYPAMREMDAQFNLQLSWMNPHDPIQMGQQLRTMEFQAKEIRTKLPDEAQWVNHSLKHLAGIYWEAIRECL